MGKVSKSFILEKTSEEKQIYICKECSRETPHKVVVSYLEKGTEDYSNDHSIDWRVRNQTIQCLVCETVSFRVAGTCSEDYDYDN